MLIGIGGHLAAPPLPHHRAYGSVPRRFDRVKRGQERSSRGAAGPSLGFAAVSTGMHGKTDGGRRRAPKEGLGFFSWFRKVCERHLGASTLSAESDPVLLR